MPPSATWAYDMSVGDRGDRLSPQMYAAMDVDERTSVVHKYLPQGLLALAASVLHDAAQRFPRSALMQLYLARFYQVRPECCCVTCVTHLNEIAKKSDVRDSRCTPASLNAPWGTSFVLFVLALHLTSSLRCMLRVGSSTLLCVLV